MVAVLGLDRGGNRRIERVDTDNGNEWHHLLFSDERVILIGLSEEQFCSGGHAHTGCLAQHRGILAYHFFLDVCPGAATSAAFKGESCFGKPFDGFAV